MVYEYRCTSCKSSVVANSRLEDFFPLSEWFHDEEGRPWGPGSECTQDCEGPLKRTWSVGFQIKSTDWGH